MSRQMSDPLYGELPSIEAPNIDDKRIFEP
jgi:hypothetical protein